MFSLTVKNVKIGLWLWFYYGEKINDADPQLTKINNWIVIENEEILTLIKRYYDTLLSSGLTFEEFLRCQLVKVGLASMEIVQPAKW